MIKMWMIVHVNKWTFTNSSNTCIRQANYYLSVYIICTVN